MEERRLLLKMSKNYEFLKPTGRSFEQGITYDDSAKIYEPTEEELKIIKEIFHELPDREKYGWFYIKTDSNKLYLCSPQEAWDNLSGRLFLINLDEKTAEIVSMN